MFNNLKRKWQNLHEKCLLIRIRDTNTRYTSNIKYLYLDNIKGDAKILLKNGHITKDFYNKVFISDNPSNTNSWYEANHDFIYGISD